MKIATEEEIEKFVSELRDIVGDSFEKAILYGSYAREEQDIGSDIDIAVIVSGEVDQDKVFRLVDRYRNEKGLEFSPRFFSRENFESKKKKGYSFYQNVADEGVEI